MAKPDPVAAALAQAKAEADAAAGTIDQDAGTSGAVATQTTGTAVGIPQGQRRSLADLAASALMSVDVYLGVDDLGIKVGKDKSRRDLLMVELRFKDMKGGWIIRGNTPAGVKYHTSYDGATEAKSRKPWEQVIAQVQQIDGNAYVSDLIELPVTLIDGVDDFKDKSVKPIKPGARAGVSISYMNFKHFSTWFAEMLEEYGQDTVLKVRLGFEAKTGGGNSDYGVFTWEVVD